jgi:hypothetical protein
MLGAFPKMMHPHPHASDEVTDLIASIEMHRQEIERESGLEASRSYAMPRLQELLKSEQEAAQQPGAENNAANIEAVNAAIRKVQSLQRGGGQRHGQGQGKPKFRGPRPGGQGQGQGQGGQPGQPGRPSGGRNRNRRHQARRGGGGGGGGGNRQP